MIFEAHITCHRKDADRLTKLAKAFSWKTSQIESDPVLGDDVYFYLTAHDRKYEVLLERMRTLATVIEYDYGLDVLRQKIELIMFDTKMEKGTKDG